jgi:hypothetical protein
MGDLQRSLGLMLGEKGVMNTSFVLMHWEVL